jgi:hypothetical protein
LESLLDAENRRSLHYASHAKRQPMSGRHLETSGTCFGTRPSSLSLKTTGSPLPVPRNFDLQMFYTVDLGTTTYPTTNGDDDVIADAWFDSGSSAVGTLFQTLGVKSMRVGGTTTEEPTLLDANATYPQQYDAAHVSNFAQQWGLELIWDIPVAADYNLSTYTSYIESMIATQKSKRQNFKEIWEIGNEPDQQNVGPSAYDSRFDAYLGALRSDVGTSVQVLGPSELSTTTYIGALMDDPEYDSISAPWHSNIYAFSHHFYPFGCASGQSSLDAAIGKMLELHYTLYTDLYNSWAATAASYGYNTRYDEGNSFCGGGYNGASNAFAAALWGLDVLEYHAHNTSLGGINFHVADGAVYSAFSPQLCPRPTRRRVSATACLPSTQTARDRWFRPPSQDPQGRAPL